jgi:dTDP-4-amino-4,6-dideoxygalactose transaminase
MDEREPASQLAINGGPRVRSEPWRGRSDSWHIGLEEKAALDLVFARAIETGVSPGYNGPEEEAYCSEFAAHMSGGFADAVSSGTAALYAALRALDLEPFTEVVVSAITDPGGMMPIPLLNLIPTIADSAPGSFNSGPDEIEAEMTPLTSAIVVAHIGGEPADVAGIAQVARRRGIPLIEDCAQAQGATLHGCLVGTFGDVATFSTMHGKHLASGAQGGIVYTRNRSMYERVRRASDRGKPFFLPEGATNVIASLNLNLNEWACAMARVQLRKLPEYVRRNADVTARLAAGIHSLRALSVPPVVRGAEPNYWFLRLRVHPERLTCGKPAYCAALAAEGLPITARYTAGVPHLMDWFTERRVFGTSGYPWACPEYAGDPGRKFPCPNAQAALDDHLILHCHEHWDAGDVDDALTIFRKVEAAFLR